VQKLEFIICYDLDTQECNGDYVEEKMITTMRTNSFVPLYRLEGLDDMSLQDA
jgi:hypothetical protein